MQEEIASAFGEGGGGDRQTKGPLSCEKFSRKKCSRKEEKGCVHRKGRLRHEIYIGNRHGEGQTD